MKKLSLNLKVVRIFAPILILTGILGFIIPPDQALTSGAPIYNVFHLFFGAVGILLLFLKKESYFRYFNLGFGAIDLYQAAASGLHLFPEQYFQWTGADDLLHVLIGGILVGVGLYGWKYRED